MLRQPSPKQSLLRANAWFAQLDQILSSICVCTGMVGCAVVLTRSGSLRLVGSIGTIAWEDLVAELVHYRPLPTQPIVLSNATLQVAVLPLQVEGTITGYALLPAAEPLDLPVLQATALLIDHALAGTRRALAQRRATIQLRQRQMVHLRKIRNSRNYLRGIIDTISVGLVLLDADGTVRAINSSLAHRFGKEPSELVGTHYRDYLGDWQHAPSAHSLLSGQTAARRLELTAIGGSRTLLEISSFPLQDSEGTIQRAVEVWEDITERTSLQMQLVRAEKLAAIGQLAASIAHEVGNPLQAIQGFIALFLEAYSPDMPNRSYLQVAEQEIERVARVITRLRDFYRPSADVLVPVQLNTLLEDVLLLASKQLQRSHITVENQLQAELPEVPGVADQLKQVILNLILNAIDAMPNGGTLRISTALDNLPNHQNEPNQMLFARLTIADTGYGIAPERLAYLFDGIQTTKSHGMGLGLYTSKAIIERHMGRIIVQSSLGKGTCFTILIPIVDAERSVS